jgi:cellulose synthase/poly-beta-1,6-N-acetylglucosamine synthase-like glycosyltransferase
MPSETSENTQKVEHYVLPSISIIIPVHNEELVIERRLTNISETNYPKEKMEVIVTDSGSDDRTREIIFEGFGGKSCFLLKMREEERPMLLT